MKQFIKSILLPRGPSLRRIKLGLARGVRMYLDLQNQSQRWFGLDEQELAGHVERCLPRCETMVDIGANDGFYTLVFLKSPAKKVIACEPSDAADRLVRNAAANGHTPGKRLILERRLIGKDPDQRSLRDLVKGAPGPIFIKMDIDGGEVAALESAEGMSQLDQTFWIVETHSPELERGCVTWFEAHGFATELIEHAWWRKIIPELRPLQHNRWLYVHPLGTAKPLLTAA